MAYQPPTIYSVFILSHQTAQKNGVVNCQLQIIRVFWNYLNNRRRGFYIPAPMEIGEKVQNERLGRCNIRPARIRKRRLPSMPVQGDYVQKSVHGNMLYSKSLSNGLPKGEKKMKQIEKWLTDNGITYRPAKWGNPDYFNDGFNVSGLIVTFDFYLDPDTSHKMTAFERYMIRKKSLDCKCYSYGAGFWFRVLTVFDGACLEEHEKRVSDAIEAFWQAEHARRQQTQATV